MPTRLPFIALLFFCEGQFASASAASTPMTAVAKALSVRKATAKIDGATFHYYVIGDLRSTQTPILVLHGAFMSADYMRPLADKLAATRPVILLDQRGHGRTGDVRGPITYERLADDAAAVLTAAGVRRADVLGFSMGGGAAIQLAVRHPDLVGKLVSISASYSSDGLYPNGGGSRAVAASMFEGTPLKRNFDRLAPAPQAFPILVDKINALQALPQAWPKEQMRAVKAPTMVIIGDHDIIMPEHAVDMYRLRGGADPKLAATGVLSKSPPARLAVLPATAHLNIMAQSDLIIALVVPFLDDQTPAVPDGFF